MLQRPKSMRQVMALGLALLAALIGHAAARAQDRGRIEIVPNIPHSLGVKSAAFSRDGARLVSGSQDKSIKLWDTATGRLLRTLEGHADTVSSVAFSPDGTRVVSGSHDNTVKLWDAASGKVIRTLQGHRLSVTAVAFSPDGRHVVSAGSDGGGQDNVLRLWDAATGQPVRTFEGHAGGLTSVAFSRDGTRLLSGAEDKTVRLWDVATGKPIRTFAVPSDRVDGVAFSPDGTRVLSGAGADDAGLKLWDAATGQLVRTFEKSGRVYAVAFSPDGMHVLASGPREAKLWNAATGELVRTFSGHELPIYAVAFSPDGTHLLTGAEQVKLWNAASGQLVHHFRGLSAPVLSVAPSPDGKHILSGGADHTLKLWDAATGQLVRSFLGHGHWVRSVAFSSDGTRALSSADDRTLKLWDTASGQLVRTFEEQAGIADSAAISPDGARLVSNSMSTLKLWDAANGQSIGTLRGHRSRVESVVFSPDGSVLASGSDDRTIRLWNSADGKPIRVLEGHTFKVAAVAFSRSGQHLLSGSNDKTVKLWDAASGQLVRTLEGHSGPVQSVAFSASGQHLLSGSWDKTVRLWDAASGQGLRTLEGHSGWVTSVAFSPDGTRVLSASLDSSIRIWSATTGQHLASQLGSQSGEWLVITPEGFFDASAKGAEMLTIVRGLDAFGVEQLYQALYRPDLVREKLAGDPNGKVKDAAAKLDLAKLLDSGPVPTVAITSHKAQDVSPLDAVTMEAHLADRGGGVGRAEWRINGITVGVVERTAGAAGKPVVLKQTMALDPGENIVELTAYNGANLVASIPARARIAWTGSEVTVRPRLHVLAVGINDYLDGALKLTYAVPDATALASALQQAGRGHYEDVVITRVVDGEATASNLDKVFADLAAKVRPRDVFVFFAAGHGKTLDGRYHFIPYDLRYSTDQSIVRGAISQEKLQGWFSRILARKAVLMFDTCEAGSLTERPKARGGLEQKAALGRLIQATGRATLTASTATQEAYEGHGGHGVFTFALLDALARGDLNSNGLVELAELIQHVDGLVPAITEKRWGVRQFPQMDAYGSNFPLANQVAALAPGQGDAVVIPVKPTHVNIEGVAVFKEAGGIGDVVHQLAPFTTVTLVKSDQGWALIARDGQALGYTAAGKLHKLN